MTARWIPRCRRTSQWWCQVSITRHTLLSRLLFLAQEKAYNGHRMTIFRFPPYNLSKFYLSFFCIEDSPSCGNEIFVHCFRYFDALISSFNYLIFFAPKILHINIQKKKNLGQNNFLDCKAKVGVYKLINYLVPEHWMIWVRIIFKKSDLLLFIYSLIN